MGYHARNYFSECAFNFILFLVCSGSFPHLPFFVLFFYFVNLACLKRRIGDFFRSCYWFCLVEDSIFYSLVLHCADPIVMHASRLQCLSAEGSKVPSTSEAAMSANVKPTKATKPPSQKNDSATVAASEKKGGDRAPEKDRKKDVPHPRMQYDDKSRVEKAKRRSVVKQTEARNRVELFRHLPQYEHGTQLPDLETKFFQLDPVHPAIYKVSYVHL